MGVVAPSVRQKGGTKLAEYAYDYLRLIHITSENSGAYPNYPCPWFLVVDSSHLVVGDGRTPEAAQDDHGRRPSNTPSPEAVAAIDRASRLARRARRERRASRGRMP